MARSTVGSAMRRLLLGLILSAGLATQARADFDAGTAAYERADYAAALEEWRPLAQAGDAEAQFAMGLLYVEGSGVEQDDAEALVWFRRAAEQGHASSQFALGQACRYAPEIACEGAETMAWYRRAAEQGLPEAQYALAGAYAASLFSGEVEVTEARGEIESWLARAAAQGMLEAQVSLAEWHLIPEGAPNAREAYFWLTVAAGRLPPGPSRDNLLARRRWAGEQMTGEEIQAAEGRAQNWRPAPE